MFGLSGTELAIILVLALLLLGPSKLPELARSVGKAVRDFKRATGDIRNTVESEFYRMDQAPAPEQANAPAVPTPAKAPGTVAAGGAELPPAAGKLPDPYAQAEAERAATAASTPEDKATQLEKDLAGPAREPAAPAPAADPKR